MDESRVFCRNPGYQLQHIFFPVGIPAFHSRVAGKHFVKERFRAFFHIRERVFGSKINDFNAGIGEFFVHCFQHAGQARHEGIDGTAVFPVRENRRVHRRHGDKGPRAVELVEKPLDQDEEGFQAAIDAMLVHGAGVRVALQRDQVNDAVDPITDFLEMGQDRFYILGILPVAGNVGALAATGNDGPSPS